jgi:hypothetical protein
MWGAKAMSALPSKADMCGATSDVRFGPIADNAIQGNEHAFQAMVVLMWINAQTANTVL